MNLFRTSILSFIATLVKMLSLLAINKAVALFIGPSGLALIGQFQNFIQTAQVLGQGGLNQGAIKLVSENRLDGGLSLLLSTLFRASLVCSTIVGVGVVLFSTELSESIFKTGEYRSIFQLFGVSVIFFVFNQLILSVLNGMQEIGLYVWANIVQSLVGLIITCTLIMFSGLYGALIALAINQAVAFVFLLWVVKKHSSLSFSMFFGAFDMESFRKLRGFAYMAITSALMVPVSQILVRDHIVETIGLTEAGYWQAIWSISTLYLTVVTTALSVYFLPKLAEITCGVELRKEMIGYFNYMMPLVLLSSVIVFCMKDFIIYILFSDEFSPVSELFLWQLIGDVIKMAAWFYGYMTIAKGMTKVFIFFEVQGTMTFTLLAFHFLDEFGLVGVTYAFALNYLLYLFMVYFIVARKFKDLRWFSF